MDKTDLSILTQSYKIVALVDKDPGSKKVRDRFKKRCDDDGIPCHQLERRAIENYFTPEALRHVFPNDVSPDFQNVDPRAKLQDQIGIDVKKNNRSIARAMSVRDIADTDLHTFLRFIEEKCTEG